MAAYVELPQGFNLTGEGEPERLEARYATSGFLPLLGIQPIIGRAFTPEEDKPGTAPAVLISHRLWQSHFGSVGSVVGRTIMLDGRGYTLAGVLPASFQLAPAADLWMPVGQYGDDLTSHVHHEFTVVGRLKDGIAISSAQAELEILNRQEAGPFPDTHKNWNVFVGRMQNPSAERLRPVLLVLFGAVVFVLLIACANVMNLILARNAVRQKEIALRIALGATLPRLAAQLLTESTLLTGAGRRSWTHACGCGTAAYRRSGAVQLGRGERRKTQLVGAGLHCRDVTFCGNRVWTSSRASNSQTGFVLGSESRNKNIDYVHWPKNQRHSGGV